MTSATSHFDLDTDNRISAAAHHLLAGGLVVFPTETVYGLGAVYADQNAIAKIFEVKNRPLFDPLILHISDLSQLEKIALPSKTVWTIAEKFWPGPLTLVLPKRPSVSDLITAGLSSVAIRLPAHPVALELISRTGMPVAAPSANRFGGISPTSLEAARAELGSAVKFYLGGGNCSVGLESTVLSLLDDLPLLLRPGGTALEDLEAHIGIIKTAAANAHNQNLSPGRSLKHYAPLTPLHLWDPANPLPANASTSGLITPFSLPQAKHFAQSRVLARQKDLREVAVNFFAALRDLDSLKLPALYAVLAPPHGLGRAINDRLQRAAAK